MSGNISGSATLNGLSPSGDSVLVQHDGSFNQGSAGADASLTAQRQTRHTSLLPDVPSLPTLRGRMADGVFVLFLLVARCSSILGAVVGGILLGFPGVVVGLAGGWVIGVWMRWSLGLRRRGLTHGFVVRMLERGNNDRAKLLESLVETLRGHRLSARQCRMVAAAYAEATRRLQTCESQPERVEILQERDRKIREAAYGQGHALLVA
jgi:hypothetical protein